jgi:predicted amidohydrolase
MDQKIVVAAAQMNCTLNDKKANLDLAYSLVKEAKGVQLDLVVFPELFNTGYRVEENDSALAEPIPGPTSDWMQKLCKEFHVYAIGAILEQCPKRRGVIYDTAVLVGPKGIIGRYRKIFLWQNEAMRFSRGIDLPVFDLGFAKIGIQICYEVGFPDSSRILTLKGADILVFSAAFNKVRTYAWDIATQARALENGLFVVASNRYGIEKNETAYSAHSRIIDPRGEILIEAVRENELIIQEIDLNLVKEQREALPYLRDYDIQFFAQQFVSLKSAETDEFYR